MYSWRGIKQNTRSDYARRFGNSFHFRLQLTDSTEYTANNPQHNCEKDIF